MSVASLRFLDLPDLAQIRVLRKQLGWTQRELGRAAGLSQSFINKIERNEADPGYRTAKKIFQALYRAINNDSKEAEEKTTSDVMTRNVEYVTSNQTIDHARKLMIKYDYSQLPVIDNGIVKGSITDRLLVKNIEKSDKVKVRDIMESRFPIVDLDAKLDTLRHLLEEFSAVLVDNGNKEYGIVTKHDLLKASH